MGGYDRRYMVKQYVAEVTNQYGYSFRVFKSGVESVYLFCQMDEHGCDTGLHIPIQKRDLTREVASALANGYGIDTRALA